MRKKKRGNTIKKIILTLALLLVGCSSVTKLNVDTAFKDLEKVEIDDLNITSSHLQEYYYDENKYSFYLDMENEEIDQKVGVCQGKCVSKFLWT